MEDIRAATTKPEIEITELGKLDFEESGKNGCEDDVIELVPVLGEHTMTVGEFEIPYNEITSIVTKNEKSSLCTIKFESFPQGVDCCVGEDFFVYIEDRIPGYREYVIQKKKEEEQDFQGQTIKPYLESIYHLATVAGEKCNHALDKIFITSMLAGMFIGVGGLWSLTTAGAIPNDSVYHGFARFLFGAIFPFGSILVVFCGGDLFSANNFVVTMGLLFKKINLIKCIRMYVVSFIGNLVGGIVASFFFGYMVFPNNDMNKDWIEKSISLADYKMSIRWYSLILSGCAASWLISIAVFLTGRATTTIGKMISLWWPISCLVSIGFEHCVANAFFIPLGLFYGSTSPWYLYFYSVMLTAVGNFIGGTFLGGVLFFYIFKRSLDMKNFLVALWRFINVKLRPSVFDSHHHYNAKKDLFGHFEVDHRKIETTMKNDMVELRTF